MSRPLYENNSDLVKEGDIVSTVCAKLNVNAFKLPIKYRADYAMERNDSIVALAEIKDRNCASTIKRIIMSLDKWTLGCQFAKSMQVPFCLFVRFSDGVTKWIRLDDRVFEISINGRNDRGDKDDHEPVIWIPTADMKDFS